MPPPNDDDLAAYRASLKRSSFKVDRRLLGILAAVAAFVVYLGWLFSKGAPESPAKGTETTAAASVPPSPPAPPTPREITMKALQGVADTYAPLDETSLPEAPIALALGRKVVFVGQSLGFDPETAKKLSSKPLMPVKVILLPRDFVPGTPPELATSPEEAGVVVLERETMETVGTYTGGKEPAIETRHAMVAILVPEKKRVAAFTHTVKPKAVATRLGKGKDSVLVGNMPDHDDAWMIKAARALSEGREPESTTAY